MQEKATALVRDGDLALPREHDGVDAVRPRHAQDHIDVIVQRQAVRAHHGGVGGADGEGEEALLGDGEDSAVGQPCRRACGEGEELEAVGDGVAPVHDGEAGAGVVQGARGRRRGVVEVGGENNR